jgi:hypothetical protein
MGTKRPFADVDQAVPTEDSVLVDGDGPPAKKHKHKKNKKHKTREGTINWVKKRARTLERRFRRDHSNMPADVQNELERELAAHQQRLAGERDKKQRKKMITKYHMVRFFGMLQPALGKPGSGPVC